MSSTNIEFSKQILTDKITPEPSSFQLSATAEQCGEIAKRLSLPAVNKLEGNVTLTYSKPLKAFIVEGDLKASVVQECIVTGDDVPAEVSDSFESYFVANEEVLAELEEADPKFIYEDVELLEDEFIDVGELFTQYLSLFLDPYPKKLGADVSKIAKKGVEIKTEEQAEEDFRQERNPFGVLKSLKKD